MTSIWRTQQSETTRKCLYESKSGTVPPKVLYMKGDNMKTRLVLLLLLAVAISTYAYAGRGKQGPTQTPVLTEDVEHHLLFLREEEKLARDVYLYFFDSYKVPIFDNISKSEQAHMDAVKRLLDTYGLDDPAAGLNEGEFNNEFLDGLYDSLTSDGDCCVEAACLVGGFIEEYDILDIIDILAIEGLPSDVKTVCENLLKGSHNHLRAFVGQWEARTGTSYVPILLSDELYKSIIEENTGTGGRRRGR
jgi:hypothetical protein